MYRLLKSQIFVVQIPATPKNGVEFWQKSIGAIKCNLATSYEYVRFNAISLNVYGHTQDTHTQNHLGSIKKICDPFLACLDPSLPLGYNAPLPVLPRTTKASYGVRKDMGSGAPY